MPYGKVSKGSGIQWVRKVVAEIGEVSDKEQRIYR